MSDESALDRFTLSRRRFLTGVAVVAAAAAVPLETGSALARGRTVRIDPAVAAREARDAAKEAATAAAPTREPLSIGFVKGSGSWPKLEARPWVHSEHLAGAHVVPAGSLPAGNARLIGRRLTVIVQGLYPVKLHDPSVDWIVLDADFDAANPASVRKLFAWTARYRGGRAVTGRAVFEVEPSLARHFGFELGLSRNHAARVAVAQLVAGTAPNTPKLREGCYLLSLSGGAWDKPRRTPALGDPAWRQLASLVVTIHA
jgi:hypothetical protein